MCQGLRGKTENNIRGKVTGLYFRLIKLVQHFRFRRQKDARLFKMQNYHAKGQTVLVDCVLKKNSEIMELRGMKVSTVINLVIYWYIICSQIKPVFFKRWRQTKCMSFHSSIITPNNTNQYRWRGKSGAVQILSNNIYFIKLFVSLNLSILALIFGHQHQVLWQNVNCAQLKVRNIMSLYHVNCI